MVSSTKRQTFTLAISLLLMVISLTGAAMAAVAPTVAQPYRVYPTAGFEGAPGKIARDVSGNLYVTDFWAQGIWKFDRRYNSLGFIKTESRPVGVAYLPLATGDKLVVSMQAPRAYVAFYNPSGNATGVPSNELGLVGTYSSFFRPSGIAVDDSVPPKIFVVETGDTGVEYSPTNPNDPYTVYVTGHEPGVRVFSSTGSQIFQFGSRAPWSTTTFGNAAAGQFMGPTGIAYEKVSKRLYVADTMNGRIQMFNATDYTSAGIFGTMSITAGAVHLPSPQNISFEYIANAGTGLPELSRIYIADRAFGRVQVTDQNRVYLKTIDAKTVANGELVLPSDAIYASGVLVVSSGGGAAVAGGAAPASLTTFAIDGRQNPPPPDCGLLLDPVAHNVTTNSIALSGSVSLGAGACQVSVQIGSGSAVIAPAPDSNGHWSYTASPLALGTNALTVKGFVAGDSTLDSIKTANTYYIASLRTPGPTLTLTAPSADTTYVKAFSYTMQGTATKSAAAATAVAVDVYKKDSQGNTIYSQAASVSAINGTWNFDVPLEDGVNNVCAVAWQESTVDSTPICKTIIVDNTPPAVGEISFLQENSTSSLAVVNVSGIVREKNFKDLVVTVNGVPTTVNGTAAVDVGGATQGVAYSAPIVLARGANIVTVTATDQTLTSTTSVPRKVYYEPTAVPGLTINATPSATPADNIYEPGTTSIVFSGKVANPTLYPTVSVANLLAQSVNPADGSWSATVDLQDVLEYGVVANPAAASGAPRLSLNRTISNKSDTAKIAITDPPADTTLRVGSYTVRGTVAPNATVIAALIREDGTAVAPAPTVTLNTSTGVFSFPVTLTADQTYVVKVTSTTSGTPARTSTTFRNLIYDTTQPAILQAAATVPGQLLGTVDPASIFTISAKNSSNVTVQVQPDFFDYDLSNNGVVWHADLTGLNTISFTATDPAGNTKTVPFTASAVLPTGDADGNGLTNNADVMLCLRHVATIQTLNATQIARTDVGPVITPDKSKPSEVYAVPDGSIGLTDCLVAMRKATLSATFKNQ